MLVNSIDIIKLYVPVNKTSSFTKMKSAITSTELFLSKVISPAFYAELDAYFNAISPTVNSTFDLLIPKLQNAITNLAYFAAFEILSVVISDSGIHRTEAKDGSKKSLFQRQEENLKFSFSKNGYLFLDDALSYMEVNKASLTTWTASSEYTLSKRNFINSTAEFDGIYGISKSHLVFQKLRRFQRDTEKFLVLPAIGRELFDELKTQIANDNLSAANALFLPYLQDAVAYGSIEQGGYQLQYSLSAFGYSTIEHVQNTMNFATKKQATADTFDKIISSAGETAEKYIETAVGFLNDNIADYPLYADSDAFIESFDRPVGTDKVVLI